ncbi:tetratricopeptide repeat protein [Streptomyces iconiensis]|uniref:Tetratricopeptide repeat protein n=1 Tax=Streptomyces iconiensis TaxID=1384038 RepID=A0ABT6ZZ47_9ACTN|nr:tetratricopeptide repeat protein [Streptomyces iconiensis]MDJ1134333.1 tetratricopeptide repeat protein [Streptomyces iconiensis]
MPSAEWERRVADAWAGIDAYTDQHGEAAFRDLIGSLAAEQPQGSAPADFERASSFDSTGHPDLAVPLYESALRAGLTGERRQRAVIQLASSLRNLGRPEESVALLTPELGAPQGQLDDAVRAVLALALTDLGRAREGVGHVLTALAPHLPRYQRSMGNYARLLTEQDH